MNFSTIYVQAHIWITSQYRICIVWYQNTNDQKNIMNHSSSVSTKFNTWSPLTSSFPRIFIFCLCCLIACHQNYSLTGSIMTHDKQEEVLSHWFVLSILHFYVFEVISVIHMLAHPTLCFRCFHSISCSKLGRKIYSLGCVACGLLCAVSWWPFGTFEDLA
jgi:hypothetical protein